MRHRLRTPVKHVLSHAAFGHAPMVERIARALLAQSRTLLWFMSAQLQHVTSAERSSELTPDHPSSLAGLIEHHLVQFYDDEAGLVAQVSPFLTDGLRASDRVIVIATADHGQALLRHLEFLGFDVPTKLGTGQLTVLDARETLMSCLSEGTPRRELFESAVGSIVAAQAAILEPHAKIRAYGEMVDVLWQGGQRSAALALEALWGELQARYPFTLLCSYSMASFFNQPAEFKQVCAAHTHVSGANVSGELVEGQDRDGDDNVPPSSAYGRRLEREIAQRVEVEAGLRSALGELRLKEEQLQVVTDALPTLVAFVGNDERYKFVSAAYERWFGYTKAEVIGKHMREVLGDEAYEAIVQHVHRALGGEEVGYEAEIPYCSGGARFVEARYIPQRDHQGSVLGFVALVSDITERKAFERFRGESAVRAERLLRITEAIAEAVTAEQIFQALVDRVAEAIDASSAGLWLLDDEGEVARLVRGRGYSDAAREHLSVLSVEASPTIPAIDCVRTRSAIWIPSQAALLEQYPHLRSLVTRERAYRISCLPLIANGRPLGALAFTIDEERRERAEEREFLLLVGRYATQSIERLRLLNEEKKSRNGAHAAAARLDVLNRVSRAFAESSMDLSSRLKEVVSELARALDSCISLSLVEDGLIHSTALQHPDPQAQNWLLQLAPLVPLKLGEGVTGQLAQTGDSVLIPVIEREELLSRSPPGYREFLEQHPVFAMMGAALRVQGRVIGTVTASQCRQGQTYTSEDLSLLEELAQRAATAIENSRLYEESISARKRAEQLYVFAQSVVSAERVEEVFDAAIVAIATSLGTSRSAVLTFDEAGILRFRASHNLSEGYRRAVEGHCPWPRDAEHPDPVLVSNVRTDPTMAPFHSVLFNENIHALAFIPLVSRGRLLGKFMLYYEHPHIFSESEINTAAALGNHLASVIARFQAVGKLEETVRYNELFAGVLAHDLRSPLGAMMNAAQLILMRREGERALGEHETRPLSRILSSGQRMGTMIEQLLDFTRVRSGGGLPVVPHSTNLAELCGQAVSEIELAHPEWTIQKVVKGDLRGIWDSDRLLQLFSNLVVNAGQHGISGEPVVVKLDGTSAAQIRIEVHNSGSIPAPFVPDLFEPFGNTQRRRDRSRGLGLGLFIVREIARCHGGTVELDETSSDRVIFVVQLPRYARPGTTGPAET